MRTDDFDYPLPKALIAQAPLPMRSASRLLVLSDTGLHDASMRDFASQLGPADLLVFNDTRVVNARLQGRKEPYGGQVEILVERVLDRHTAVVMLRASKTPAVGGRIRVGPYCLTVLGREAEFFRMLCPAPGWNALMECQGLLPLPPYIQRAANRRDEARYQSLLAAHAGAVAAPTASLHFDQALFERIRARGVEIATLTLHVGAGTFTPVRVAELRQHQMHAERITVSQELVEKIHCTRARGGRVVAIGTTVVRALESAASSGALRACAGDTRIFIYPGYRFRVVDALLTNFHLPQSTLLMLVSAFAGRQAIAQAYQHAVENRYRFFSYGDAMFIAGPAPSSAA